MLVTLSKLLAPIVPFTAETLYQNLVRSVDRQTPLSVHHCLWPEVRADQLDRDLLASMAKARGRVKTREALLDEIRDRNYDVFDRSIDVHISSLRKKLGDDAKNPRFIRTLRSAGYMLTAPDAP